MRKGAAIGIALLALTLVACSGAIRAAEKGAEVAGKAAPEERGLTVIEDARLKAGLDVKAAVRAESPLDKGAADAFDGAAATEVESVVLERVKEEAGELFREAICQGMLEIALWKDPSATVDPAHWVRFLADYVEQRARELLIPTSREILVNRATKLAAGIQLGKVNVAKALPFARACLAALQTVARSTPPPTPPTLAVGDSCLVGRWIGRSKTITLTVDNAPTLFVGGAGAVLTIDARGTAVVDYGLSSPFVGRANGQTVAIQQHGQAMSRIHGYPPNRLVETSQSEASTTQVFNNGQWQQPTAEQFVPSTGYSCSATTLIETYSGGTDTYTRG